MLVGLGEADDAAVIATGGSDALVLTLDFFTPLVDDAFTWGQIAAANAASDVYAMGGRPFAALNIVGWPRDTLSLELLADVLRGGREVADRAGFIIVGGHSVDDPEPKYGMVVIGRADVDHMMTIAAASPGDVLVLTKPLGTGVITTALKAEAAPQSAIDTAVASMTTLNDEASKIFLDVGVRACTDVTGFGLLGHLRRMLEASGVSGEVDAESVPVMAGVTDLIEAGHVPGGTKRNLESLEAVVDWGSTSEVNRVVLGDAQTSGGLLGSCDPEQAAQIVDRLEGATIIGRVTEGPVSGIRVT